MNVDRSIENVLIILIQQVRTIAAQTTTDRDRFRTLYPVSRDILQWLHNLSPATRHTIMQQIEYLAQTGITPETTNPLTPNELHCFAQFYDLTRNPPPTL